MNYLDIKFEILVVLLSIGFIIPLNNYVKVDNAKTELIKYEEINNEYTVIETLIGNLTGYGSDCEGCTGTGRLACTDKVSLANGNIHYNDSTYGSVRIIAGPKEKFACGSIVRIKNYQSSDVLAIVLDRGSFLNKAYQNGTILMDLAFSSEKQVSVGIEKNIEFEVLRYGW